MVKYFCLFVLLTLTQSCYMFGKSFEISEKDYISNQIIVDFAKKMQKKGLHACGLGGRVDKGKIMDFQIGFQYDHVLDISSARRLMVETVLLFLDEINSNEAARKYLFHHPFTPNDVIITIYPDHSILSDQDCIFSIIVDSSSGKIDYSVNDGIVNPLHTLQEESFTQAQEILK